MQAIPLLPPNPWFQYYGFPWDVALFAWFAVFCFTVLGYKGLWLWVFTYSVWEMVDWTWTNPVMVLYVMAAAYSLVQLRGTWRVQPWALSVLLAYRIGTAFWALPPGWTSTSCGLVLCPGSGQLLFIIGQISYTLVVFGFALAGFGGRFLPGRRKDFEQVLRSAFGSGLP